MLRQFSIRRIVISVCLDFFCTMGALLGAAYYRSVVGSPPVVVVEMLRWIRIPVQAWEVYSPAYAIDPAVFVLVALIWPFFFVVFRVYDGRFNPTLRAELGNILVAIVASTLTLAGVLYFTYQETSRILFVLFLVLNIVSLLGLRIAWWLFRTQIGSNQKQQQRHQVLIVGAGAVGKAVAENIVKYAQEQSHIIGFVDDDPTKQHGLVNGFTVLGSLDQIADIVQQHEVQDAVVALPLRAHERLVDVCNRLQRLSVRVHVIPDLFALSFPRATLDGFGGIPVIDLGQPGIYGWQRWLKRIFDVIITTFILFFIWPLLLLIGLLVRLDSPGPIFYRQKRVGEHGASFEMMKFRSMRIDSDDRLHREHITRLIKENTSVADGSSGNSSLKLKDDPRVTRVGVFIRKTSLDELPQLFNVLRGEMSLVGPRPPIPYEVELYQDWHRRRLEVLPGITGIWQVKGRNRVGFDEMVRMDIEYIDKQSVWLDMKLLFLTPIAAVKGNGAG